MSREKLESRIASLAEPFIASQGLQLWGIELTMAHKPMVRIFVDNEEGASIDQCARISRHLGVALEVEDVMQSAYILEVSSPGLERPFFNATQMASYVGRQVELTLLDPNPEWPGRRKFSGELVSVEGDAFVLRPCEKVAEPAPEKPKKGKGKAKAAEPKFAENKVTGDTITDTQDQAPAHNDVDDSANAEAVAEKPVLCAQWSDVKKAHLVHIFPEPGHNKPR
ncbi:MAG: ribosome maturation factor [Pseudomonadota bacterium]